ncbi:MAG: hypothetical protein PHP62_05150 [Candidatus Moranbacteria bacterium]|nr:hypothetical protein [Candidatus Moranbacteria bacterium]
MTSELKIKSVFRLQPIISKLEKEIEQMKAVCSFLENQESAEMVAQELIKKQKKLVMNTALLNVMIHQNTRV